MDALESDGGVHCSLFQRRLESLASVTTSVYLFIVFPMVVLVLQMACARLGLPRAGRSFRMVLFP